MPQDAYTLRLVAKELDHTLAGGRINKINQPAPEEVSLLIYTGKRTLKLVLNVNASDCGAYFTEDDRENPLVAPNFCMLLRKYVQNAEVLSVSMPGFERVVRIALRCTSDFSACERVLVAEIMGKYSNLLLLENGVILGALKTASLDVGKRAILAGAPYTPPLPQDKINPQNEAELRKILENVPEDLQHYLFTRIAGIAPRTAAQIAESYRGGDLAAHVRSFLFSDEIAPCVVVEGGVPVDFSARQCEGGVPYPTLSEAQSAFYGARRKKRRTDDARRRLNAAISSALKKQRKRLQQILEKRQECADAEDNRIKGELITANLYALSRGMRSCELPDYYSEAGGTRKIALDPLLSPAQNAQAYFKRYRKQKRALAVTEEQERETREELEYLAALSAAVATAESEEDFLSAEEELVEAGLLKPPASRGRGRRQSKAEIPYRTYERGGFRIYAGRNNLQNDRLVRQSAPDDLWLHARLYHSAHVVIRTEGRRVPEDVIAFAAAVCAKYSDANGERIPVDCCAVRNVKKPPKSKAGFVIYSQFETVRGDPALLP